MTQPIAHGYPDWHRVSAISDVIYVNTGVFNVATEQTFGPFFVAEQGAIGVALGADVNSWRFRLNFYNDSALSFLLERHEMELFGAGKLIRQALAVLGPWMTITALPSGAGSDASIRAWGVAQPATPLTFAGANVLIDTTNNAIAIGASEDQTAATVWPGNAFLAFQMTAGTATLELRRVTHTGSSFPIWRRNLTAAQPVGEMVCLTGDTIIGRVINTSGAATTYSMYLVGQLHVMRS